jgi:hypothetical protein
MLLRGIFGTKEVDVMEERIKERQNMKFRNLLFTIY